MPIKTAAGSPGSGGFHSRLRTNPIFPLFPPTALRPPPSPQPAPQPSARPSAGTPPSPRPSRACPIRERGGRGQEGAVRDRHFVYDAADAKGALGDGAAVARGGGLSRGFPAAPRWRRRWWSCWSGRPGGRRRWRSCGPCGSPCRPCRPQPSAPASATTTWERSSPSSASVTGERRPGPAGLTRLGRLPAPFPPEHDGSCGYPVSFPALLQGVGWHS